MFKVNKYDFIVVILSFLIIFSSVFFAICISVVDDYIQSAFIYSSMRYFYDILLIFFKFLMVLLLIYSIFLKKISKITLIYLILYSFLFIFSSKIIDLMPYSDPMVYLANFTFYWILLTLIPIIYLIFLIVYITIRRIG